MLKQFPNNSGGRIEGIWPTKDLLGEVKKAEILPRTIADHNPVEVCLERKEEKIL